MLGRLKRFAWRGEGSSVLQYNREQRGSSADGRLQCAPESFMAVLVVWCSANGTALCGAASEGVRSVSYRGSAGWCTVLLPVPLLWFLAQSILASPCADAVCELRHFFHHFPPWVCFLGSASLVAQPRAPTLAWVKAKSSLLASMGARG